MGKHKADKYAKLSAYRQAQVGRAPQAPRIKTQLSSIARRGK